MSTFRLDKLSIDPVAYGSQGSESKPVKTRVRKGPLAAPRPCALCGDLFAPHRKNPNAKYCSRSCAWHGIGAVEWTVRMGPDTAKRRGDTQRGRGQGKSYRKLYGRHEHRAIAERKLGRPLAPGEIVHHDDENIQNNDPGNLKVLASQSEHAKLHFSGKKHSPEHVRKRVESRRRTMAKRQEERLRGTASNT